MKRTDYQQRLDQYAAGGRALAKTARRLGAPISADLQAQWEYTMIRLAMADDRSEISSSDTLTDTTLWLRHMDLDETNPDLFVSMRGLLLAYAHGRQATTLPTYFDLRAFEAVHSINLLRFQSPLSVSADNYVWQELTKLCIVGTNIDALVDCKEDAESLPFSAQQLARGAINRIIKAVRSIDRNTVLACLPPLHDEHIDTLVLKRLPRSVMGIRE